MERTFKISVYLKKAKANKQNEAPVYGRITVNQKRAEVSLQIRCNPKNWDASKSIIKGNNEDIRSKNLHIQNFVIRCRKIYLELIEKEEFIDAETIRNRYIGKGVSRITLSEAFNHHIAKLEHLVGIECSKITVNRYRKSLSHVLNFIKNKYYKSDIYLQELKYLFIIEYEYYLKVDLKHGQNSALKHIQRLRKIIKIAIINEWLERDPFASYSIKKEQIDRECLTSEELSLIENKTFLTSRLSEVRDMFVFSCYTGLAYIDIYNLLKTDVKLGIDGSKWLMIRRQKTNTPSRIPLLQKALEIIDKYKNHHKVIDSDKLLPVNTNQKMNEYLKEIADLCGINKRVTFHLARHTFATTVTLTNGVSIETVSKMLGHKSISTTQIYSKVVEEKISMEMNMLKAKLSVKNETKTNQLENQAE